MKKNNRILSIFLAAILLLNLVPINLGIASNDIDINNLVESSYPHNNQEGVEINPLIRIKFKHSIELIDKNKINLSSDGNTYAVDIDKDVWINYDEDTLKIDINSIVRGGKEPLRKKTAYKLTIEEGALKLKDKKDNEGLDILNKEINLYFITGEEKIYGDTGLYVEKYSSDIQKNDNISSIYTTKLDIDGSIYIHFNREIQWNKWDTSVDSDQKALSYFKIYKKPVAYKKEEDSKGNIYDKEFRFDSNRNITTPGEEIVDIGSVEILKDYSGKNTKILKITPKDKLINLNQYRLVLTNKEIITDYNEKVLRHNINQSIWTKTSNDTNVPKWNKNSTSEEIIEDKNAPYKTYTIHGVPNYNEYIDDEVNGKPIILYVDKEVIVNPYNQSTNSLSGIRLYEGYGDGNGIKSSKSIKWHKLEYYFESGVKKTKVSLYPIGTLDSGKYHELRIDNNVFVTRGGKSLEGINLRFVVEGKNTDSKGIYKIKIDPTGDNKLLINYFNNNGVNLPIKFTMLGFNFTENIEKLELIKTDGSNKKIIIPKSDLKFENITTIYGEIKGNAAREFSNRDNLGEYKAVIHFTNDPISAESASSNGRLILKDRSDYSIPKIIRTNPTRSESFFNTKTLYRFFNDNEKGNYITAIFEDKYDELKIKDDVMATEFEVLLKGDSNNLVDSSRKIQVSKSDTVKGEYSVYIPIKDEFREGQTYTVYFPGNIVYFQSIDNILYWNEEHMWEFSTNVTPKVDHLFDGSIPEEYDTKYPIVLQGDNFNQRTDVKFISVSGGRSYSAYDVRYDRDGDFLYVYLPRNRKLPVGLYDIVVSNDRDHETEYVYGVLSVVEEGDNIPNEEYSVKSGEGYGDIHSITKTSEDTILLRSRYTDRSKLELDLDKLMGEDVWIRNIEYEGNRNDSISTLNAKSKWVDAYVYNLTKNSYRRYDKLKLSIGRAEPIISDSLKVKLQGKNIKSDFIQVSGENFSISGVKLYIPFKESDGNNLKVLRYDEDTRRFEEVGFTVNKVDKTVEVNSNNKGIFVVIE